MRAFNNKLRSDLESPVDDHVVNRPLMTDHGVYADALRSGFPGEVVERCLFDGIDVAHEFTDFIGNRENFTQVTCRRIA